MNIRTEAIAPDLPRALDIRRPQRRSVALALAAVLLLAFPLVARFSGDAYFVTLGSRILIYGLAASSLGLLVGFGGMVSLGHAAFVGLGAYVVAIVSQHAHAGELLFGLVPGTTEAWILWPAAALVTAGAGALIGALSLRTRGVHFIMITLAFAQMLYFLFVSLKTYGGDEGLSMRKPNALFGLDLGNETTFYYVCLALLVAFLLLLARLVNSRFGMVIRGCRDNERRMAALGYSPYRYKLTCFVLASAVAGLAGALLANQERFVSPEIMHWTKSGELLVMVLLGGMGTVFGPGVGAVVLLALETGLASVTEHWMVVLGPLLVLAVLFTRNGVLGSLGAKQ